MSVLMKSRRSLFFRGLLGIVLLLSHSNLESAAEEYPIHTDLQWTKATLPFLKMAYSAPDYSALLRNIGKLAPEEDLVKPMNEKEERCSMMYNQLVVNEQAIPSSAYDLPLDIASSPATSHALTRITDLLVSFNDSNRVFVLIGDSMSRNSLLALDCILNIENGFGNVDIQPPLLMSKKIGWGATNYVFQFPHPVTKETVTFRLFYMAVWEAFKSGQVGWYDKELSSKVFSRADDVQLLIAFNIGMHERNKNSYSKNLKDMFSYANSTLLKMGKNPTKNKFIYRETTAQHYNRSAGYYDLAAMKKAKYGRGVGKRYICVSSASTDSAKDDWRYQAETHALRDAFDNTQHVHFVPIYAVSRHYHDMHPTFVFHKKMIAKRKGSEIDCTHFEPAAAVILHRILWHSLLI